MKDMSSPTPKILLIGATGYVGGAVLHHLLTSSHPKLSQSKLTLLVRGQDRADLLKRTYGERVQCLQFTNLSDTNAVTQIASQHDIIINAGTGFHPSSAEALVRGLAQRRKAHPESPAWLIHTSGCSNISDKPLTGTPFPDREWDDADSEAVFRFEQEENQREWYAQRAAELVALETAIETGVNALSIQAPCIFGRGEGLFNQAGLMIPIMMGYVLAKGYGLSIGDESGVIDYVHVSDLADLYVICVEKILDGKSHELPNKEKGIVFPVTGRIRMYDIAAGCLDTAFAAGVLPRPDGPKEKEIRNVDLTEAATTTAGNVAVAEFAWGGHRKTKGTVARTLGWSPSKGEAAWKQDLSDELQAALQGKRGVTIDSCIAERE